LTTSVKELGLLTGEAQMESFTNNDFRWWKKELIKKIRETKLSPEIVKNIERDLN
jgi:hypothetical protein